ncbi:hypothetical protein SLNWT_1834 [Streptomyces albus]|uniref:Uncharacterized protein n=1 Tax=Streptomyces albus (strain ATCC 21838 / DSM 41398 / FERM P-419 / JCM 4703 / NBRC 107858) TaxID=1081613 RepID=A0A0B5ESG3_STRA4|nr:hypothetical protein SLNWT_1834 [Streptomyces albus]AOU76526.1 hypothetical protein SLNHY_1835 [Streptomyces albus]AYN32309.1 hypothetical protein DUI70_1806 [Streptomyces albus]
MTRCVALWCCRTVASGRRARAGRAGGGRVARVALRVSS